MMYKPLQTIQHEQFLQVSFEPHLKYQQQHSFRFQISRIRGPLCI